MGHWDGNLKHLVNFAPEDFVRWLVGDAQFEGESEQLWLRRRFAMLKDTLLEAKYREP